MLTTPLLIGVYSTSTMGMTRLETGITSAYACEEVQ